MLYTKLTNELLGHETESQSRLARRHRFRRALVFSFLSVLLVSSLLWPTSRACGRSFFKGALPSTSSISDRVHQILSKVPLIDGHNDLAILIRAIYNNHIYDEKFTTNWEKGGTPGHVDLPRLRAGQNGGAFWSVYAPCPKNGSDWSDANYAASVQFTLEQIDVITRLQEAYPHDFSGKLLSKDALEAFKEGKLISPLGVEGLHQIGNSAANLRQYSELGVRYATLTHNCGNIYADSALVESPLRKATPYWGGLSPRGKQLIHEMNRLGMIVDLSHTSVDTMVDVLKGGSVAPVIFSHSSAYAICPHPRNVPDHVLKLVKDTNSLVMVNIAPDFISCVASGNENGLPDFYPANSTIHQVARHIIYIGDLIGYDHVGLGTDFDGIGSTPDGLGDVSKFPDLIAELLRFGVSDADAAKIVGLNILRVWRDVDQVSKLLKASGTPALEGNPAELGQGSTYDT